MKLGYCDSDLYHPLLLLEAECELPVVAFCAACTAKWEDYNHIRWDIK